MLVLAVLQLIYETLLFLFAPLGGVVTELPFGMQTAVDLFASSINTIIVVLPMLDIVWTLFLFAVGIKVALISIEMTFRIIQLIRG